MVNIVGIFAIVFVYYCEINAEIDNLQYKVLATADVRKIYVTKKELAGYKSNGIRLRTNEAQPDTEFTTVFRGDTRNPHIEYDTSLVSSEARNTDLNHPVVKSRRFKRNNRDEEIDEQDNEKKKKHHHHSKSKMNYKSNATRNKKTKQYKNDKKRNYLDESDNRDKKHRKNKKRNKKKNHREKKSKHRKHSNYSKHPKDLIIKLADEDESKSKQREKSNQAIDKSKDAVGIPGLDSAGLEQSLTSITDSNLKPENITELVSTSTTTLKPQSETVTEYVISNGEALKNDLEHPVVRRRSFKLNHRDEEYNQIDEHIKFEHDNERKKPKMKKKHLHHSERKIKKNKYNVRRNNKQKNDKKRNDANSSTSDVVSSLCCANKDRKEHKDKNRNNEKNHKEKNNKDRNHTNYSKSPKDTNIKLREEDGSKPKQREKSKQAMDKSKDAMGVPGLGAAGLGQSLTSITDLNLKPKTYAEPVTTSTTTPKPQPEPVPEHVDKKIKLPKRQRLNLRTGVDNDEGIRSTKMILLSLNAMRVDEKKKMLRLAKDKKIKESPPSILSPYAIKTQIQLLMEEFPKADANIKILGRTVEYNNIVMAIISEKKDDDTYLRAKESKYIDEVPGKKIIFIVHGLTVMGMKSMTSLVKISELKLLLSYYFKHLDKFDIYLIPLANPDGYAASLDSEHAIWNKNVSPQSVCPGVFLDRNFDVAWNTTRKISSCSQLYPGATAFTEEESKAIRDVFHNFAHKIQAYIHVHAGTFNEKAFKGEAILYPPGYTESQLDEDKYVDLKGEIDEVMTNASFRVMSATVDTLFSWYGQVSGSSVDYAATVYGIPFAVEFVMQLYDTENLNNNALTEIWSRLIDTTFNNIWKSSQASGGDARRWT